MAEACHFSLLDLGREDYKAVQTLLNAAGFDAGTPDGQWGPGSRKAMAEYQASVGLPETGTPDRATLVRMGILQE
ncbi:peptidoglycan-binding protein [Seohaeicola zhoushanensis]